MPKVSIVLPVHNGERYLRDAIESVLGQSFQDWELLLVNDCSTDTSPQIMQDYAGQDRRIRYIENKINLKLPKTLNIGFGHAKGEYFTWTSDDNCYKKDAIALMVSYLDADSSCGLVYCDMDYIGEQDHNIKRTKLNPETLYYDNCVGACFLYPRKVMKCVGEYDPGMMLVEDYDYWLRISKQYPIARIPQVEYTYRIHDGSLTMTQAAKIQEQLYRLRLRDLDFLLERIGGEERIWLFSDMWLCHQEQTWQLRDKFFPEGELPDNLRWMKTRQLSIGASAGDKKWILFGAGVLGRKALQYLGMEHVHCFVDNNLQLIGTSVMGVPVISFSQLKGLYKDYQVAITVNGRFISALAGQLEEAGIKNYVVYSYLNTIC